MPASSFNRRKVSARIVALGVGLLVAGCGPQYEINRPGTWRPTGANDYNLRAMIADPRDLAMGEAAATDRGNGATRAVIRLYTDRRRPLQNVSLSKIAPATDTQDSSMGGGAAGPATGGTQ